MPQGSLIQKANPEFYRRPIQPLKCNTNSNYCKSYETSCCNFSCHYAQKQKQNEILARETKNSLLENIF